MNYNTISAITLTRDDGTFWNVIKCIVIINRAVFWLSCVQMKSCDLVCSDWVTCKWWV